MSRKTIPYRAAGRFSPLVLDYLAASKELREFYRWSADEDGLHAAMEDRRFDPTSRQVLCTSLDRQYQGMDLHPAVRANLDLLARPNTLTITTGHQLCLFTGPLYVPFKILNVIRLARELSTAERAVVPVFWMATEDHDRAEIDHTFISGKKVTWPGTPTGAVGRLKLDGIGAVLDEVDVMLGLGTHADAMRALLRRCYRPEYDLAKATRLFVDDLFGRFGLLILDGDDRDLKAIFAPVMREEAINQVALQSVRYANEKLAQHHKVQAFVREINLFHLRPGHRSRIELQGELYQVLDGGPAFTLDQLLIALEEHPENFSPNVLMRPIYQESILPNIAYVGGGGELAYWFQLKWLFQALQVPMPVLLLRTSAAFLGVKDAARIAKLGLTVEDLFAPMDDVAERLALQRSTFDTALTAERKSAEEFYRALAQRAKIADVTLERSVNAIAKRAVNGLDALEKKLIRAAKHEQCQALEQLQLVHDHLFPSGALQERHENFMPWFVQEGPAFFDRLLSELDPLDTRFSVLQG